MLTRRLTTVLAATCAVASSNIYLIQPVLGQVAAVLAAPKSQRQHAG
ncbi:hypothetical protein [Kutzneria sp. NPDC051319]